MSIEVLTKNEADVLEIKGTNVLERNINATTRFVINQGGTRSSKTYSIAQRLIIKSLEETGLVISIVRKTMPSLRSSAMKDFFTLFEEYGLYDDACHNKSENIYRLHGNEFEFFGLDEPQKIRGRKRDYLWLNEANEFAIEDFKQLNWRTRGQIFFDYNPSDEELWIYELMQSRPEDCTILESTYLDAKEFLPDEIIREIELLEDADPESWSIYGLGKRGHRSNVIYRPYDILVSYPEPEETIYGIDFGFNNPTALLEIGIKDMRFYLTELLYESGLTNARLIQRLESLIKDKNCEIYADAEDPNRIAEIHGAGFNVLPADKGADSVIAGIQFVKGLKLYSRSSNVNLHAERAAYKWKTDKNGKRMDEPIKFKNHLMDAKRYALYTHLKSLRDGRGDISFARLR
jgi:phage terminase large subunit